MAADTREVLEGPIRQVGYIVRDLDAAMRPWLSLGVGPWFTIRNIEQKGLYRGEHCLPTLSIAFANSGPMQIELIQQHGDTPSIYREFLEAKGEGFHQFAWWVTDFETMMQKATAAGWPIVWSGGGADGTRFAYFELDPTISTIVEVTELNDGTRGLADLVESAAKQWDGVTDPVRSLR